MGWNGSRFPMVRVRAMMHLVTIGKLIELIARL